MADYFRAEGLPAVKHTAATKAKLDALNGSMSISEYLRVSVLEFAKNEGFNWIDSNKPDFISAAHWLDYEQRQAKSRKNGNQIDYTYLIAFRWLQHKFDDLSASVILRRAVLQFPAVG